MNEKSDVLKTTIEAYLNGEIGELNVNLSEADSARDKFVLRQIKRLKNAFDAYRRNPQMRDDFLGSLRNYLLTTQASIRLGNAEEMLANNAFGISIDEASGECFASFQLPAYIKNQEYVESAFLKAGLEQKSKNEQYDLTTGPLVRSVTGFTEFKTAAQKLSVHGAISTPPGHTTLVALPTGGGKSLITQTMAYQEEGLTIVVVPTVSLAIDQVRAAKDTISIAGADEAIFYYCHGVDIFPIKRAIEKRVARMLFISPEALMNNNEFRSAIKDAATKRYLKNIVIDEAHIVVDWGASFRVDFQCLECWRKDLLSSNPGIRTILLSATYEENSINILKSLFSSAEEKWIEIRCDELRHEPRFMCIKAKGESDKQSKAIELIRKLPRPLIAYVARPSDANRLVERLSRYGMRNVRSFTGETGATQRKELIEEWANDEFEVMVATSAFGVGVDKSDVRTVLHLCVPQNPNAYYQELGRGGRDRMPCLSVMCVSEEDRTAAWNRIKSKVLTEEKIVGRWYSMYHSKTAKRIKNLIVLDTSVKPNYSEQDSFDDSPTSHWDRDWNIYVLLFLRRHGLIGIQDIDSQNECYLFIIEIFDNSLREGGTQLKEKIMRLREAEVESYRGPYDAMCESIKNAGKTCWSEMFCETYWRVSEYCAGCDCTHSPSPAQLFDFPLKKKLRSPVKSLDGEQAAFFANESNVVLVAGDCGFAGCMDAVCSLRPSIFVSKSSEQSMGYAEMMRSPIDTMLVDVKMLKALKTQCAYYYLSGVIAIKYDGTPKEIWDMLKVVLGVFGRTPSAKLVHIVNEDYYFDSKEKRYSDLVGGSIKRLGR